MGHTRIGKILRTQRQNYVSEEVCNVFLVKPVPLPRESAGIPDFGLLPLLKSTLLCPRKATLSQKQGSFCSSLFSALWHKKAIVYSS